MGQQPESRGVSPATPMSTIGPMVLVLLGTGWLLLGALALVAFCAIGSAGRREDEAKGYVPDSHRAPVAAAVPPARRLRLG